MQPLSYSVVIRTLGTAGESYQRLLQSIESQTIQPEEVIVVIPHGYTLNANTPKQRVVYSTKGMCTQRAVGFMEAKSEYILVVDDDIEFAPDMVEQLYGFLCKHSLDAVLPLCGAKEEGDTIDYRRSKGVRLRGLLTGQYIESNRKSKYLDVLTHTAGHKVYVRNNKKDELYYCTTSCFQCFFIKTSIAQERHYEQEKWLEEGTLNHYAAYDEPVFYYPLQQKGLKMAYYPRVGYTHLDEQCGHITKGKLEAKISRYYSISRNRTVYWYKCIWKGAINWKDKTKAFLGGCYWLTNYTLYNILINLRPKYWQAIKAMFLGYKDARKVIKAL